MRDGFLAADSLIFLFTKWNSDLGDVADFRWFFSPEPLDLDFLIF